MCGSALLLLWLVVVAAVARRRAALFLFWLVCRASPYPPCLTCARRAMSLQEPLAPNVVASQMFVSRWLPQSDALRHPAVRLAVLGCGLGSVNEALLAGVPVLCLPFTQEQLVVGRRVHDLGAGVTLDTATLDASHVHDAAHSIVMGSNSRYASCAVLPRPLVQLVVTPVMSRCRSYHVRALYLGVMASAGGGASRAADVVQSVAELGSDDHMLGYHRMQQRLWERHDLDIIVLAAAIIAIVSIVIKNVIRLVVMWVLLPCRMAITWPRKEPVSA